MNTDQPTETAGATPEKSAHTPGPLYAQGRYIMKDYGDRQFTIAEVWGHEEQEADAILFAAAPDLLEACKMLVDPPGFGKPGHRDLQAAVNLARAAIKKAEGKAQ